MHIALPLRFALVVAPLFLVEASATAQTLPLPQEPRATRPHGWLVGASIGVPTFDGDASPDLFTVALHGTQLRRGGLGADFAVGTIPRAIAEGVAVGFARAGVALPFQPSARLLMLPSAGITLVGAATGEGGGATNGLNAGLAAVMFGTGSVGMRTGVTWHFFRNTGTSVLLWELGLVHVPRPR